MDKKAALITVHGMGSTPQNYNAGLLDAIEKRLGQRFSELHVGSVYYQGDLQANEDKVWRRVADKVHWSDLRKFVLFGFADATGLECGKEAPNSAYTMAQTVMAAELLKAQRAMGKNGPVLMVAQSLGCQVVSCYFWDARVARDAKTAPVGAQMPRAGIWQNIASYQDAITGNTAPLTPDELVFLQGDTLRNLVTTGCNIPIFVAAHARDQILPITPNTQFVWDNYYDSDDVLGWPLAELSDQYALAVKDHQVNANSGLDGLVFKSWNPLSHNEYWGDSTVLDAIEAQLKALLG
jgi:hypothetical protein